MSILRSKWVALSPVMVAIVVLIFSLVLVPTVHPKPQKLPVASFSAFLPLKARCSVGLG
ncbi:hypothetical protein [Geobacillus zalihae]|uniref:hypothetical protein n=1 Tax=Geobacillus zalihae TaxID=213419 RepID=UPI0014288F55|nr:hypothetical protein [Geobacillus zalihae]